MYKCYDNTGLVGRCFFFPRGTMELNVIAAL